MSRSLRCSIGALLVVAACASPTATPSSPAPATAAAGASTAASTSTPTATAEPTPAPLPTPSTFTSSLYAYSLTLPGGWSSGPAILRWDGISQPGSEEPEVDKFGGPASASAWAFDGPFKGDLAAFVADRITANHRDHGDTCPEVVPEVNEPIHVGGEPAVLLGWDCGILINQAVIVRQGIAFTLCMRDPGVHAATDPADRAILDGMLSSVTFAD